MADRKQATDNFDNEFRMEKKTAAKSRGKLPSWIMILAGAAVIGGVVAARQPVLRPVENGTRASVNVTDNSVVVADPAGFTGMNDQKADSAELEAFFGSQSSGRNMPEGAKLVYAADQLPYEMNMTPLELDESGFIVPPENTDTDAAVYWLDDKPYAVTISPAQNAPKDAAGEVDPTYTIGDTVYSVKLEKVSDEELGTLSEEEQFSLLKVSGGYYRLSLEPVEASEAPAQSADVPSHVPQDGTGEEESNVSPEPVVSAETPAEASDSGSAEADPVETEPVVVESADEGDKPSHPASSGSQILQPVLLEPDESAAQESVGDPRPDGSEPVITGPADALLPASEPEEVGPEVPSDVPAPDDEPFDQIEEEEQEPQVIAWLDEKPYAVTVKPHEESAVVPQTPVRPDEAEKQEEPVVFEVEGRTYEVQLKEKDPADLPVEDSPAPIVWADTTPLEVSLSTPASDDDDKVELTLNPVAEEKLPALLKEHFGEDYVLPQEPEEEPTEEPAEGSVEEPAPEEPAEETPEPEKQGWFSNLFRNIFGDEPTPEPTPQVTVIPVNTPEPEPVKPTPAPIVLLVAPAAEQQQPVRPDMPEVTEEVAPEAEPESAEGGSDLDDPALWDVDETEMEENADPSAEDTAVSSETEQPVVSADPMIVVKPTRDPNGTVLQPTIVPEQEELPHTGMAESWNIPSMLALLAGLMLLIIGIRRLRSRE